jgi:DNA repair protein RadC
MNELTKGSVVTRTRVTEYANVQIEVMRIREKRVADKVNMDGPETAKAYWEKYVCPKDETGQNVTLDREHLVAVLVDTKQNVIGWHLVSLGTVNESLAHPREIFRAAIAANAYAVVLMHNHPSGDCTPSQADMAMTRRVSEAAKILGIQFLDHVIVGEEDKFHSAPGLFSFKQAGIIA